MPTLDLSNKRLKIGAVFTPPKWADFAVAKFGLFDRWIKGASIFDPTMGRGDLLFTLIEHGIKKGESIKNLPVDNLYGTELNSEFFDSLFVAAKDRYGITLSRKNFINEDIFFLQKNVQYDVVFGNPPWQNFVDLPVSYKKQIKQCFFDYDLIKNTKNLLLGGSRIDIAALVLHKVIQKNLKENGEAVFFVPLSILLNDGANKFFRKYNVNGIDFCVDYIFDFNDLDVFENVNTRYGLVHIKRDCAQKFPINFERWEKTTWKKYLAKPMFKKTDPLSLYEKGKELVFEAKPIAIKRESQPRQGINTCGANDVYFFDKYEDINEKICLVSNKSIAAHLPKKYIHPLITGKNFSESDFLPRKWVFLPYHASGKPLGKSEIVKNKLAWKYLSKQKKTLANRKGVIINAWIKRGIWWALLGVGKYNFYPYKVVWESYGKDSINPKIFAKDWQANQSLQAFIPLKKMKDAGRIKRELSSRAVDKYLHSLRMEGVMSWAQPGKIMKLIEFSDTTMPLFGF